MNARLAGALTVTLAYSYSGRLEEAERQAFFSTLSQLLGVDLGTEPRP